MNIVVLAGGLSTERNVSLTTGAKVSGALIENGHHAILADVFMGYPLSGSIEEEFEKATTPAEVKKISELVPDIEEVKRERGTDPQVFFGENILAGIGNGHHVVCVGIGGGADDHRIRVAV